VADLGYNYRPSEIISALGLSQLRSSRKTEGIQTSIHYPPVSDFSFYRASNPGWDVPLTRQVANREVTLPLYPTLTPEDVEMVVAAVDETLKELFKGS